MESLAPLALGFVAGITVLFGAISIIYLGGRMGVRGIGFLNGLAGGVLAYLALEAGSEASELVEKYAKWDTLGEFSLAFITTTIALIGTWMVLTYIEGGLRGSRGVFDEKLTAYIVAIALGIHNVGEGFAIAASLLAGYVASAVLFTAGFAIHNYTEGFAIAGPLMMKGAKRVEWRLLSLIAGLSLLAGLPVIPGALVYYLGFSSDIALATLYTIATASIVYAMLHINLSALSKLGGVSSPLFWISIFSGIGLAYTTETILLFSLPS